MGVAGQDAQAAGAGMNLFDLAQRRLQWLGARQGVLAQNVANADTPGWVPRDVKPFADVLGTALRTPIEAADPGSLEQTNVLHMAGLITHDQGEALLRGEKAPDGNQVSLDRQLERIAETDNQHEAVTAIYSKYLGLFRTALGK